MMRLRFDQELDQLKTEMMEMGALCETAIAAAVRALIDQDMALAERVAHSDHLVDEKERKIENLCMQLILRQQPVARDLRKISSALKIITDMERIGDQAADIAEITHTGRVGPGAAMDSVAEMARAAISMVNSSIDAYVRQDVELARAVIEADDVVDDHFDYIRSEIVKLIGRDMTHGEYAVDILMIAKYLERIGDHATNIAEWVEFSVTGSHRSEGL
jgi:phosphate transport system protein